VKCHKAAVIIGLMCRMGTGDALAGDGPIRRNAHALSQHYIVNVLQPEHVEAMVTHAQGYGARVARSWRFASNGFAIEAPEGIAVALSHDPRVAFVEEDSLVPVLLGCPATQVYPTSGCADGAVPWQLDRMDDNIYSRLDGRYTYCYTGNGVRIYVEDSGVRASHDDFALGGGQTRVLQGVSIVQDGHPATDDLASHGTAVASLAAGRKSGPAKDALIVPVRVYATGNTVPLSNLIAGLTWVRQDHVAHPGPAVLNLSISSTTSSSEQQAVRALLDAGVIVVVGAGNEGANDCGLTPQGMTDVITVGSTDRTDTIAIDSNYGACLALMAPGVGVGSGYAINDTAYDCNPGHSGTSFATGLTSGIAAVYAERYWGQSPANIRAAMIAAALPDMVHGNLRGGTPNRLLQGTCFTGPSVGAACPPVIRRRAAPHQIVVPGGSATLAVEADPPTVSYQWYKGTPGSGSAIAGATTSAIVVTPASLISYWVRVANTNGQTVDSDESTVGPCVAPSIATQPQNASPVVASAASGLSVGATGSGLAYQWFAGDSSDARNPVAGATAAVLSLHPTSSERYWVRVSGQCGTVDSVASWMPVYPQITTQPVSLTLTQGSTAKIAVEANGSYLHYTWRSGNGGAIAGAPDAPLYLTGPIDATTLIWCDVISAGATVQSYPAYLTLGVGATITSMPVTNFGSCRDVVVHTDVGADDYLWYQGARGDTSMLVQSGANELFACPSDSTTYWCRIVTGICYSDSPAVTLP
jgi:hypothetical protein